MSAPVAQTEPVQDPVATPAEPAPQTYETPAVPAVQPATGPWAEELNTRFTDAEQRAAVDAFLRESVQPHVTRVEQERAGLRPAEQLWNDLTGDESGAAYLAITEEMFGADAASAVEKQLAEILGQTEEETVTEPTTIDPRVAKAVEIVEANENAKAYNKELERVVSAHPEVNPKLFHPFVSIADGDFDKAYEGYNQWATEWAAAHGGQAPALPEGEVAPAVIGSDTQAGTAPPVEKQYGSVDEALDAFFEEQREVAAPLPVGTA